MDIPVTTLWTRPIKTIRTRSFDIERDTSEPKVFELPEGASGYELRRLDPAEDLPHDKDVVFETEDVAPVSLTIGVGSLKGRPLHQQIIDAETPEAARELVREFGPLSMSGLAFKNDTKLLPPEQWGPLGLRYSFRRFLSERLMILHMTQHLSRTEFDLKDVKQPDYVVRFMERALSFGTGNLYNKPSIMASGEKEKILLEVEVKYDEETDGLSTSFTVPDPLTLAKYEIISSFAAGAIFRTCDYCGRIFGAGTGRSRAIQSRYCSDNHRSYHKKQLDKESALARKPKPGSRAARAAKKTGRTTKET